MNGFFANNKDQSSQISYIITLKNKYSNTNTNEFTIEGNLLYWSLIKCQRMKQSIWSSKIYSIINGFNLNFIIKQTLAIIYMRIDLSKSFLSCVPTLIHSTRIWSSWEQLVGNNSWLILWHLGNHMRNERLIKLDRSMAKITQLT